MPETTERLETTAPASPDKPKRSLEDIAAERESERKAVTGRQAEAVAFDERCAAIGDCLMDLYAEGGKLAADFEPYVEEGGFPDEAATALAEYEAGKREKRPDFDITGKHPKLILRALREALEARAETEIIADRDAEAAETSEAQEEAEERNEEAETEKSQEDEAAAFRERLKDLPVFEYLETLASAEAEGLMPEDQRERARAFLTIRALAQTETDAALIAQKIARQDFSEGVPDPAAFIRHEIFSSSGHETGFSEEMQDAVARTFGLDRPPKADTGSEVRVLATATTPDPETGEPVPTYTAENPAEFRPGVGAWSSNGEDVNLTVAIPGHPPVTREVTGWNNDDIGLLAEAMAFASAYEQEGVTGFVEDIYKIDFALIGDSAFDRESLRRIRQMLSALMGGFEGYDGDIFDPRAKVGLIHHQARLLNEDDRAFGTENSREDTLRVARKLGLQDEDGNLNLEVLKAFGAYAQETYLTGEGRHADLQARLYRQFPEFVKTPDMDTLERAA